MTSSGKTDGGHRLLIYRQFCSGGLSSSGLGELPDRKAKMSRISTKSYRLENWGESGQTKTAWRSEESNKRAYLDGRAASYSHRARCGRKHCVQRTDVQLQLGEEEGSLGSFSMSFENAQEQ